jgi:hypothetical protein
MLTHFDSGPAGAGRLTDTLHVRARIATTRELAPKTGRAGARRLDRKTRPVPRHSAARARNDAAPARRARARPRPAAAAPRPGREGHSRVRGGHSQARPSRVFLSSSAPRRRVELGRCASSAVRPGPHPRVRARARTAAPTASRRCELTHTGRAPRHSQTAPSSRAGKSRKRERARSPKGNRARCADCRRGLGCRRVSDCHPSHSPTAAQLAP